MTTPKYSIEISRTGNKCSNGEDEHRIHIFYDDDGLICEYEKSSTSQLARKLAEIHYLIDEIYALTSKNNGGIIRCTQKAKINGNEEEDAKCFCDEYEVEIEEIPRRDWVKITNSFKKKVGKIFEDNPCRM